MSGTGGFVVIVVVFVGGGFVILYCNVVDFGGLLRSFSVPDLLPASAPVHATR